jgi:hypothetical protein
VWKEGRKDGGKEGRKTEGRKGFIAYITHIVVFGRVMLH